jgi:hypothetical protein
MVKLKLVFFCCLIYITAFSQTEWTNWKSTVPASCPFPPSTKIFGVKFTGRMNTYPSGDTYYPSWAADGNMYSCYADGDGVFSPNQGFVTIAGNDCRNLTLTSKGQISANGSWYPYSGLYPSANLFYNDVWYYGQYTVDNGGPNCNNWCIGGPFVGFWTSIDKGKTFVPPLHNGYSPLFGENAQNGKKCKIMTPHIVDFGQNMQYSPDGSVYMVAHGATRPNALDNWIAGDQVYLLRCNNPSVTTINDLNSWEFYSGKDGQGNSAWTHDFSKIVPLLEWNSQMGCVTVTYDAPINRYLMCISRPTDGLNCVENFDTYILESDALAGPWKMVHYLKEFGTQAYFDNIPSKFISNDGKTVWLCYSANFGTCCGGHLTQKPPFSVYGMTLLEMKLIVDASDTISHSFQNIALTATATASSLSQGYSASGVNDNVVGGYPGNIIEEWASNGEKMGAWVKLTWNEPVTIDSIALWDRPNLIDQITSGTLTFSDGSSLTVGILEDSALYPTSLKFPTKTVNWVKFTVTDHKESTSNVGLSEFGVYNTKTTTGINQIGDIDILLYPNPVKNILSICGLSGKPTLSIFDSSGKMIFCKQLINSEIDISSFQSGIYMVKIETIKGIVMKKFVKQ